jgi:hypothetical protein
MNPYGCKCIIITPLVVCALNTEQSSTDINVRLCLDVKLLVNCYFPCGIINNT